MKLNSSELIGYCSQLHQQASNINNILANVKNSINSIQSNHFWSGPAHDYYHDTANSVTNQFEQIYEELEKAIKYAEQVANKYDNLEKQIIDGIIRF